MRTGYNKVKEFHARVDRGVLGKYWHLKPYEERTLFIAFPEHLESNFHYHLLAKVPADKKIEFLVQARKAWSNLVPSGSIQVGNNNDLFLKTELDRIKTLLYATKNIWNEKSLEDFIISPQFINPSFTG